MNDGGDRPPQLASTTKLRRTRGIAWRIVEEEAILVNVRRDEVIHLDNVGAFIWSRLDGRTALGDVAGALVEEFEVEQDTALTDTLYFARRLVEQGAAEIVEMEG